MWRRVLEVKTARFVADTLQAYGQVASLGGLHIRVQEGLKTMEKYQFKIKSGAFMS